MKEYDTEKLRRLEKLDKTIKAGYEIQKLSSLLTKVHRYWMSWGQQELLAGVIYPPNLIS